MPLTKPPLRERIIWLLNRSPWLSASQIARRVGARTPSVASEVRKMVIAGVLDCQRGKGPRGGNGYALAKPINLPTWYDRILGDDPVYDAEHED